MTRLPTVSGAAKLFWGLGLKQSQIRSRKGGVNMMVLAGHVADAPEWLRWARQHREGQGRAPPEHTGRAGRGGQAEGVATEKGRLSQAVTGQGTDSNQTSTVPPHFLHPLPPESKNLLLPKLLIFAKRKPPGKRDFSTPSLPPRASSLGPKCHFPPPRTPSAATPERQPIRDAASDDAA